MTTRRIISKYGVLTKVGNLVFHLLAHLRTDIEFPYCFFGREDVFPLSTVVCKKIIGQRLEIDLNPRLLRTLFPIKAHRKVKRCYVIHVNILN